nr:NAD(P)/FAD-dependent oxidoreductase [Zhihengliuella flava]
MPARVDVAVVGAGPVGLYTAILLAEAGVRVVVLEQRREPGTQSRAIGIHPPALAALDRAGVAGDLVRRGVAIRHGEARRRGRLIAPLAFEAVPGAFPFVLALPQRETERVLADRLAAAGVVPLRGVQVHQLWQEPGGVHVRSARGEVEARFVIGADGARSTVRAAAGIGARVREYPDTYVMGDFPDHDLSGAERRAVLYLERQGVVESFPLPGGVRRWVVRTPRLEGEPTAVALARMVEHRTGVGIDPAGNTMLSSFAVRRRIADRLVSGRIALVGDAAHEVSPIGGQGMNLGWLDAARLAPLVSAVVGEGLGHDATRRLERYGAERRRAAQRAARQAHVNMMLGRPLPAPAAAVRDAALTRLAAHGRWHDAVARVFTMSELA